MLFNSKNLSYPVFVSSHIISASRHVSYSCFRPTLGNQHLAVSPVYLVYDFTDGIS